MLQTQILNGIYGIIAKNMNGYITKKQAGKYDFNHLLKDIGYGVIGFGIGFGAQQLLGLDMTDAQILNSGLYMLCTQMADKWISALIEKIKTWNLPKVSKNKFRFFG